MNRVLLFGSSFLAASALSLFSAEFKFGEQTFTVPDGFSMEAVATTDLIARPIEMDFDEEGHLYVTDSSGSNKPSAEQLKEKPHRVMRLEDTNGDGIFDKSTVFADKMMFPEGCMWYSGSLYVSAPPVIWKLTDTDGDGVADKREEWLDAKTLTGCANDLHGPYLGLDGWIYWSKGAFAEQTWEQPNGGTLKTKAAHIFRRRPEGGMLEAVMTGGMDNPVGVTFTPDGERIFTTTFLQQPGGGKRDGLIHAIYGGVYGKVNDVTDGHKKTGDLMPVLVHLGAAAPCGLTRYESEVFGKEYKDNLFATLFNMHKVTRHILKPDGATYKTEDSDFLTCDSTDFHPTDVTEDADGSLLVVNTGGWYKLCCPTSQLYKPDVLGTIYRIRRSGAPKVQDPRGLKLNWASISSQKLADLLGDSRPAVVKRALHELELKKSEAIQPLTTVLKSSHTADAKRNAIWALTRIDDPSAREAVRIALNEKNPSVQHTAVHSISVRRDAKAVSALVPLLESKDAGVRRATAEALGRLGDSSSVLPLLRAAAKLNPAEGSALPERIQEHSITYALIEINNPDATKPGLNFSNSFAQRCSLIALDQMDAGGLKAEDVIPLLHSNDAVLTQTANWIAAHRKDWAKDLVAYYKDRLQAKDLPKDEQAGITHQLTNFAADPGTQELLAAIAADEHAAESQRIIAIQAMADAHPKKVSDRWKNSLPALISSTNPKLSIEAAKATAALYPKEMPENITTALFALAKNDKADTEARLNALNAISSPDLDDALFTLARENSGLVIPEKDAVSSKNKKEIPVSLRIVASSILSKAKLTEAQLLELADYLRSAGPLEINKLLMAYEKSSSETVGKKLIVALRESQGMAGLQPDRVRTLFSKYPEGLKNETEDLLRILNSDTAQQAAHVDELLPQVKNGDVVRGQTLFNSTKAACSSCHAIGYLGGNLGPDLTRIGQVRTERDLLESIVYPSASFVRSFEPMIVITKGGDEYSGVLKKDAADEVVLGTGPQTEVHIARADISEMRPGKVSVMPQGLDQQLSKQELGDLLAFLKATKW